MTEAAFSAGTTPAATTPPPATIPPGATIALAKALSAEHAAVYAYGVVGARTSGRSHDRAAAGFDAHRARRDQLRTLITQRGGTPSEPGPTYQLPFAVKTSADAVRLAVLVEERLTTAYLELAADPDPSVRRLAALAAQECAARAYGWQPVVLTLPGMPGQTAATQAAPAAMETPAGDQAAASGGAAAPSESPEPSEPGGP
jgi:Domain of unknown function (DUF4439)